VKCESMKAYSEMSTRSSDSRATSSQHIRTSNRSRESQKDFRPFRRLFLLISTSGWFQLTQNLPVDSIHETHSLVRSVGSFSEGQAMHVHLIDRDTSDRTNLRIRKGSMYLIAGSDSFASQSELGKQRPPTIKSLGNTLISKCPSSPADRPIIHLERIPLVILWGRDPGIST
jgi:hypothetical protein